MVWQKHDNQFKGFVNMQETFHFSFQHDRRGESSCCFFRPVGKEKSGSALGADCRRLNVLLLDSRLGELPAAESPEIEIVFSYHKPHKGVRKQLLMGHEFGTARTEAWA